MGENLMDFNDRCRLCIAGSKRLSIDIFSPEGRKSKLQAKISKYLSVKVSEDDKLPSKICYQCLFRLETWVSFKKHCLDSDQTLKNWAFFCGALSAESYMQEVNNTANKSPENVSDVEKPESACFTKDGSAGRTPPRVEKNTSASHTPPQSVSPNPSGAPSASSSSSACSRARSMGAGSKLSGPLNGVSRDSPIRTSKSGRRKILRPNKAFSIKTENEEQLETLESKVNLEILNSAVKPEEAKFTEQSSSSVGDLPLKRKRGRPSKAWLRERDEALKKLKESAASKEPSPEPEPELELDQELEAEEESEPEPDPVPTPKRKPKPNVEKRIPSRPVTEMIELDDPDFGSMKFTLSFVDSSSVAASEKTGHPDSGASTSPSRLSSDSCFKEDFSGFRHRKEDIKPVISETGHERLREGCEKELLGVSSSPRKDDRKRCNSALGVTSIAGEAKVKKLENTSSRSLENLNSDRHFSEPAAELTPSSPEQNRREEDDIEECIEELVEECIEECVEESTEECAEDVVSENTCHMPVTYVKTLKEEHSAEDDSDGDLVGPPMSPLSPARVSYEVIELGDAVETEGANEEC